MQRSRQQQMYRYGLVSLARVIAEYSPITKPSRDAGDDSVELYCDPKGNYCGAMNFRHLNEWAEWHEHQERIYYYCRHSRWSNGCWCRYSAAVAVVPEKY